MLRILVCGSRTWGRPTDDSPEALSVAEEQVALLNKTLRECVKADDVVIHGGAAGADYLAGKWARTMNVSCWAFPAQWRLHGKRAGFLRNQRMLDEGEPILVIAFFATPDSKGTKMMCEIAEKAGVKVVSNLSAEGVGWNGKPLL